MNGDSSIFSQLAFLVGITGAVISYVASISLSIAQRHKVKLFLVFLVVGFLVISAHQWIKHEVDKDEKRLKRFQERLLQQIQTDVFDTRVTVEGISAQLINISIGSIGTELIQIDQSAERGVLDAFRKGSPAYWDRYAEWLISGEDSRTGMPCLSIYVNAGNYKVGLLLAYLMTDRATRDSIKDILHKPGRQWEKFPRVENFFKENGRFLVENPQTKRGGLIRYVLFFDGSQDKVVGYADAISFARELLIYQELGMSNEIEDILSHTTGSATVSKVLANKFSSIRTNTTRESDVRKIVKNMIEKKKPEVAVFTERTSFLVKIEKVIQIATQP